MNYQNVTRRNIYRILLISVIALSAAATFAVWAPEAGAQSDFFSANCTDCHNATPTTCNGCHHHGKSSLRATTNKTSYAPGEIISVTLLGGRSSGATVAGGWVRAILYDQSNMEITRSTGPTGDGGGPSLPVTLTAPAPAMPGSYTYRIAWYGNEFDSSPPPSTFIPDPNNPNHGERRVDVPFTVAGPPPPPPPPRKSGMVDFDGDNTSDCAVFRPSTGQWYMRRSSDGAPMIATIWGTSSDNVVPGDYDGDGKTDIAIYRPAEGVWYVLESSDAYHNGLYKAYKLGNSTDIPVPGDFDGDNTTDVAVYRPGTGVWYILQSSTGFDPAQVKAYQWGNATDKPVPGDYDGDGKTDIAIYRPGDGVWYVLRSSTAYNPAQYLAFRLGNATDKPVPGDYDGDGTTDPTVYRNGTWYILQSSTGFNPVQVKVYQWGNATDRPVPGDYDGDGKSDIAVWRAGDGVWYVLRSSAGYNPAQYASFRWGVSTDIPISTVK